MLITEIVKHNEKKYKIYVDYEFAFVLYKGELHKYGIKKDEILSEAVYRQLTEEILPKRAKLRAMNLLTKRPYTELKLREKLEEGLHSDACIEIAIDYVKSFGYLDDEAYAKDYITYHMSTLSRKVMQQKLLQKGINADLIASCLDEVCEFEGGRAECEQVRRLFEKKYRAVIPTDYVEKNKMIQFFLRKGYSMSVIKQVLAEKSLDDLYNQV